MNWGFVQCDNDPLGANDDGCNSDCEVEDGWFCYGGITQADTCVQPDVPELLSMNISKYNNVILEFTEDIGLTNPITAEDFTVQLWSSYGEKLDISF